VLLRPAEQPALAQGGSQRLRHQQVLRGLDPLGEDARPLALGIGVDRVHDLRDGRTRPVLDQAQVELDDVGPEQGHEGQRQGVRADVVQGHPPAQVAHPRHRAQQVGGALRQGALGDLQDDLQVAGRDLGKCQQVDQGRAVEHLGLHVHEQRQRRDQPVLARAGEGGFAAGPVELGQAALRAGSGEQGVRALPHALGPTSQGLVGHDAARGELHDRLVDATDSPSCEQPREAPRRVVQGCGGRGHGSPQPGSPAYVLQQRVVDRGRGRCCAASCGSGPSRPPAARSVHRRARRLLSTAERRLGCC
jgi:hypothetical protein